MRNVCGKREQIDLVIRNKAKRQNTEAKLFKSMYDVSAANYRKVDLMGERKMISIFMENASDLQTDENKRIL